MKQVLQNMRESLPSVVDVPVPQVRPGMALVRTAVSLVSAGTERTVVEFAEKNLVGKARSRPDLVQRVMQKARQEGWLPTIQAAFNRLDESMPLGYSSAGTIAAVGEGLTGFKVGDRVACAGGGYAVHAEYGVVPQNLLAHLPPEVDFEEAAFTTLGAIAMQGFRLAQLQLGESVAIIGLGLLGLLSVEIARAAGCRVFGVDVDAQRVSLAQEAGITAALRDQALPAGKGFTAERGFDAVLICAATTTNDPIELAGDLCRERGHVVAVGAVKLDIPRKPYYEKELHFQVSRSYGPGRYDPGYEEGGQDYPLGYVRWTEGRNMQAFVDLLAGSKVKVKHLITHRFPIQDAAQAYSLILRKSIEPFMGVLLTYPHEEEETPATSIRVSQAAAPGSRAGEQPRVGVLGAGNYARAVFLPVMQRAGNAERVVIASAAGLNATQAAEKYGFAEASSSEQDIFENEHVNTVAILTRHNQHARQVVEALSHSKNVYCEKPPALNQAELERVGEALSKPEAPLFMVGYNRRFAPLALQLKEFLSGRGEPVAVHYRINAGFIDKNHWTQDPSVGGGRIIGEGCHFIDFLTFLVGSGPTSVIAQGLPDTGRYSSDNMIITCSFADGSLGTVNYLANGDRSVAKERVEVFCAGKVGILDDFRSLTLAENGRQKSRRSSRQDKGHLAAWKAFIQAVTTGGPAPIPYEQIFAVSLATFAAMQSLANNARVHIESTPGDKAMPGNGGS